MMRTILLSLTFFLLFGCGAEEQQSTKIAAAKVTTEKKQASQKIAPKKVTRQQINLDSIGPFKKNQQVFTSKSRQKKDIVAKFPHDISLKTMDGKTLNSKEILKPNGKPVVLLFWLTTCYPCMVEMKAIKKEFPKWKEKVDFDLYAISTDFEKNYEKFCRMVDDKKWPWPAYNDNNREFRQVMPGGLNGLPQSFVLDKNGNIIYHKRKYQPGDEHALFQKIREAAAM